MLIIAHRGAWVKTDPKKDRTRQNTYEAFRYAEEAEFEAVETDVRRCPVDGLLKLSHDPIDPDDHEKLTRLSEFLSFGEWMELHLEIKEKGLFREILLMGQPLRHKDSVVYSSFNWLELFKIRLKKKHARIGILWNQNKVKLPLWLVAIIARIIIGAKSIHLNFSNLDKETVAYFQRRRLLVYAYTVNTEEEIDRARKLDLDGIFTDYPSRACDILSRPIQ